MSATDQIHESGSRRYLEVDALRGLAIAGIFLFHSVTKFNYPSSYVETNPFLLKTDLAIEKITYYLLSGKMFGIFALLYGYSFQMQHNKHAGRSVIRLIWRMLILFVFGVFNSIFFPDGDILVLYAIIGIIMIPAGFCKTPVLIIICILLLIQPIEIYKTLMYGVKESYTPINYSEGLKADINRTISGGNFWEVVVTNITKGIPAGLAWQYESGRLTQAGGIFVLGMIAARAGIFRLKRFNYLFWLKLSLLLIAALCILWTVMKLFVSNQPTSNFEVSLKGLYVLWLNLISTLLIVTVFTYLYYKNRGRLSHPLTYLGKMSLTNYLMQSALGFFMFSFIGCNLANTIGTTFSVLITILFLSLQSIFSRSWLRYHRKGPLETLWFYLTWAGRKNEK